MDDIHEQQEIANEISEAISNPVGFNTDVDEVFLFSMKGSVCVQAMYIENKSCVQNVSL